MSVSSWLSNLLTPIVVAGAKAGAKEAVDEGMSVLTGEVDKVTAAVGVDIAGIEAAIGGVLNEAINGVDGDVKLVTGDVDALTGKIVSAVTGLIPHFP